MPTDPDGLEIRALAEQYFHGIDRREFPYAAAAFTDDAVIFKHGGTDEVRGRAAIEQGFSGLLAFEHSTHVLASQQVSVDGDAATACTLAVAMLAEPAREGGKLRVRGLRYDDELVRTADGWRIRVRRHQAQWQFESDAVSTALRKPAACD